MNRNSIYFTAFEKFKLRNNGLNTFCITVISCILSLGLFTLSIASDTLNNSTAWILIPVFLMMPIATYIACCQSNFHFAFFIIMRDHSIARSDQKQIKDQFRRQYGVKLRYLNSGKIKADKRWNFHIKTEYTQNMTQQRDFLMTQVHQELLLRLAENEQTIVEAQRLIKNAKEDLQLAQCQLDISSTHLRQAKAAAETYVQQRNILRERNHLSACNHQINDVNIKLEKAKIWRTCLIDTYCDVISSIQEMYDARWRKYSNEALEPIRRVNGLKYDMEDLGKIPQKILEGME